MTSRKLLALWGVLLLVAAAPAGALAAGTPNPVADRDWGLVTGYVLDRESDKPVVGARVTVEHDGGFAQKGNTTGLTDKEGRYRVKALIGRKSSHFDVMSALDGFPIGLVMPWGLFKKTQIVDLHQTVISVRGAGYQSFVGVVPVQVSSAKRFSVHNADVLLAREGSALVSAAPADRPREQLLSYRVEPAIAAPGQKVTFTARFRLPLDGVRYTAGWYSDDPLFRAREFAMKPVGRPDPETCVTAYQAVVEVPKLPRSDWAAMQLWLDRERQYNEVKLPKARQVLLQVARGPEERAAAESAQKAFALELQDRPAEALALYRRTVAAAPKRISLWERIGDLSLQLNRPQDAVAAYEKLTAADPSRPEECATHYATALLAAGDTQRALDALKAVEKKADPRKRPPREFLLALARTYLARNDLQTADTYYSRAVKIGRVPDDVAQQFHLERARAAVKAAPESPDAHAGLARALFDLKRYEESAAEFGESLRRDSANVWCCLDLASCLEALGRDRDALVYYRQAAKLAPASLDARLGLADCSRRVGDFAAALEAYRKVAEAPARRYDFRVQHGLGLMLLAAGDEQGARDALEQAVDLARDKGRLESLRIGTGWGVLGLTPKKVTIDGFQYPQAAQDYALLDALQELQRHPSNAYARYQAGTALIELGLAEKGLAMVREAASHGFAPAEARYTTAIAEMRLGQRDDARRLLEQVVRDDPSHHGALLALARLAFERGDAGTGDAYLLQARAQ